MSTLRSTALCSGVAAVGCLIFIPTGRPQVPSAENPGPRFEVASIKRVFPGDPAGDLTAQPFRQGGRYTMRHAQLALCFRTAYALKPYQFSAPAWMDSERYDISATMSPDTPSDQVRLMLQNLLTDRFRATLHWEEKVMPVYLLIVGKNGPKLRSSADPGRTATFSWLSSGFEATNYSLSALAEILTLTAGRPVIDNTGVSGTYDFTLRWSSNTERPTGASGEGVPLPAMSRVREGMASALSAISQLGLEVIPQKIPMKILVVDRAEKDPTDN